MSRILSCPGSAQKKFNQSSADVLPLKRLNDLPSRKNIPGAETYRLLRTEISPAAISLAPVLSAVDLFTNWVEDEALVCQDLAGVFPTLQPFVCFLEKLLSRGVVLLPLQKPRVFGILGLALNLIYRWPVDQYAIIDYWGVPGELKIWRSSTSLRSALLCKRRSQLSAPNTLELRQAEQRPQDGACN